MIAVLIGIGEFLKVINTQKKFIPITILLCGLASSFLFTTSPELTQIVFDGLIYSLSAMGLYSGSKATIAK